MNIVLWIVFGALSGWIASMIMGKNHEMGIVANIIVGIIGAAIGGFLASLLGIGAITGFNIGSLLISIAGASLLLFIIHMVKKKT